MKLQYMVVFKSSQDKFEEEVNSRIKEGWIPQGGVSGATSSGIFLYKR
jgi:ribosomal protein S1